MCLAATLIDTLERPYLAKGLRRYRETPASAGVYLLATLNSRPLYVGMSKSNVVKALYRHLYPWNDYGYRQTYPPEATLVALHSTNDPRGVVELESELILALRPLHNAQVLNWTARRGMLPPEYEPASPLVRFQLEDEDEEDLLAHTLPEEVPF